MVSAAITAMAAFALGLALGWRARNAAINRELDRLARNYPPFSDGWEQEGM